LKKPLLTFFDTGFSGTPRWSPDGKWIAFDHHHETHSQIYLIDSEGRNLRVVTSGNYENVVPGWSRDGTAVYFASNRTGSWQVWRRELSAGREVQVTHHGGFAAFESYDAKTLFYSKFDGGGIWSTPVGGGGEEQQVTDALHRGCWGHFAVTDSGIYLLDSDAAPKPAIIVLQLPDAPAYTCPPTRGGSCPVDGKPRSLATGGQYSLPWGTGITLSRLRRTSSRRHTPIPNARLGAGM
jgi:hypothetical protein